MSGLISVCKRANTLICVNSNAFENLVLVTPIDIIEIGDAVNIGAGIGFFAHVIFAQGDEILRLRNALEASVKLQSNHAEVLNSYDGGSRPRFASAQEWIDRLD